MSLLDNIPSSVNRLNATEQSNHDALKIYDEVSAMIGVKVCEYTDYHFENTLKYLDNDTYKSNASKCVEYIQQYNNDFTHKDVLWALKMAFQTVRIINKEINEAINEIENRYKTLDAYYREINKAKYHVEQLEYFQDNWQALTTDNADTFFKIAQEVGGVRKYTLMYEKVERLIGEETDINIILNKLLPLFKRIAQEDNPGDLHFVLMHLKKYKEDVLIADFWKSTSKKYERIKKKNR